MAKLPDPTATLSPQAQKLYDQMTAVRGHLEGMYRALLNHPELTRLVSDLGAYLRFGASCLPADVRELCILRVARQAKAAYEWVQHEPAARKAGLADEAIASLRAGKKPAGLSPLQEKALAAAECVLERKSIPPGLQGELEKELGIKGLIELVVVCGFYQMIAGVLFAFEVDLPQGKTDPFAA
jgi:4-carboxymuconolactone decarboxylase